MKEKAHVKAAAGIRATKVGARPTDAPKIMLKSQAELQKYLRRLGPYPRSAATKDELARLRLDWEIRKARIFDAWNRNVSEINHPTEELTVDYPVGRRRVVRNPTRVLKSEAWRHNQLTAIQQQAATEMMMAWKVLTSGLSASISRYGAPSGAPIGAAQELSASIEANYREWFQNALGEKLSISLVLEILTEPRTLPEIEKGRKLKPGSALAQYQRGLDLWCEVRGWTRRNVEPVPEVPLTEPG